MTNVNTGYEAFIRERNEVSPVNRKNVGVYVNEVFSIFYYFLIVDSQKLYIPPAPAPAPNAVADASSSKKSRGGGTLFSMFSSPTNAPQVQPEETGIPLFKEDSLASYITVRDGKYVFQYINNEEEFNKVKQSFGYNIEAMNQPSSNDNDLPGVNLEELNFEDALNKEDEPNGANEFDDIEESPAAFKPSRSTSPRAATPRPATPTFPQRVSGGRSRRKTKQKRHQYTKKRSNKNKPNKNNKNKKTNKNKRKKQHRKTIKN
jgi:hypothetical protein